MSRKPKFNRADIMQAHYLIEQEYGVAGVLQERLSNQRRNESTHIQLQRLRFDPAAGMSYFALSDNGQDIYNELMDFYGFAGRDSLAHHVRDTVQPKARKFPRMVPGGGVE